MSIYSKIRIEFKPFEDSAGFQEELTSRVLVASNGRGQIDFHCQDGYIIIFGVRPGALQPITCRLPWHQVFEYTDFNIERLDLGREQQRNFLNMRPRTSLIPIKEKVNKTRPFYITAGLVLLILGMSLFLC